MDKHLYLPDSLKRTIVDVHGDEGAIWLDRFPSLLTSWEQRWSLVILPAFPNLSYNYVAPALQQDGGRVVVKAGVPGPELLAEIHALQLYDGRGSVRLLAADAEQGVLMLEQLVPGTPLAQLANDEQATTLAAQVMRALWRPVPEDHRFPTTAAKARTLQRLRECFDGSSGPFPAEIVSTAERLFAELHSSTTEQVVLHGDLHHYNILAAERAPWLAIDPKGLVGDPAYEVGALLRNRMEPPPNLQRQFQRRVDQLAEILELDPQRLASWGVAQLVLSAWWSYEDHGDGWQPAITAAQELVQLL